MMDINRLNYMDTAKGIGVILVILAHNLLPTSLSNAIYAFHMPLFFIISGYFLGRRIWQFTSKVAASNYYYLILVHYWHAFVASVEKYIEGRTFFASFERQ